MRSLNFIFSFMTSFLVRCASCSFSEFHVLSFDIIFSTIRILCVLWISFFVFLTLFFTIRILCDLWISFFHVWHRTVLGSIWGSFWANFWCFFDPKGCSERKTWFSRKPVFCCRFFMILRVRGDQNPLIFGPRGDFSDVWFWVLTLFLVRYASCATSEFHFFNFWHNF